VVSAQISLPDALRAAQHGGGGLPLIVERLERQLRQRQQGVEPRAAQHRDRLVDQCGNGRIDGRRGGQPAQQAQQRFGQR
jgi:hypothetical protein